MNEEGNTRLADVYVECLLSESCAAGESQVQNDSARCLALHRVEWLNTLQAIDSQRVLCHFRAPDAESVRMALRRLQIDFEALWVEPAP